MTTWMPHFSSDQFTWDGTRGVADISDLAPRSVFNSQTGGWKCVSISRFSITSTRTGKTRFYELDTNAPGYEDGWDGAFKVYTDNLFDGTRITIFND